MEKGTNQLCAIPYYWLLISVNNEEQQFETPPHEKREMEIKLQTKTKSEKQAPEEKSAFRGARSVGRQLLCEPRT